MKFMIFTAAMLLTGMLQAQNVKGVWEGSFSSSMHPEHGTRTYFMRMELDQHGSDLQGVFYTAPIDFPQAPDVIYRISGKISRKKPYPFHLYRNGILDYKIEREVAEAFNDLELYAKQTDTSFILYGKWFPNGVRASRTDGAGGTIALLQKDTAVNLPPPPPARKKGK